MSKWRRRLYRGIVAALLGGALAAGWLVYATTNSAAVRQQVIEHLRQRFIGAEVALGSAQLRLLGGITFSNLTLYRRDDPNQTPFLHVPAGIIQHDKEQLGRGRMVVRKIKFERPRLTVVRHSDGRWNLNGILGPVRPDVPIPIFECTQGTVVLDLAECLSQNGTNMPTMHVELHDLHGTLLNHPLPVFHFEVKGDAKTFGPLTVRGSMHRQEGRLSAALDLAPVELGPSVLAELVRFAPGVVEPISQIGGTAHLHVDLNYDSRWPSPWRHVVRAEVNNGRLLHRTWPFPIENLQLAARCDNGEITIEKLTATTGPATIAAKARLSTQPIPTATNLSALPANHPQSLLAGAMNRFHSLDVSISNWPLTLAHFDSLPAPFAVYRQKFAPMGTLNLFGQFLRTAEDWSAQVSLQPKGMQFRFQAFPYPMHDVNGIVLLAMGNRRAPRLDVNLTASGSQDRPVTIRGYVSGDGPEPEYAYDLTGGDLPLDETLILSLPPKFQTVARSFHPSGRCDIGATIRRAAGTLMPRQDYRVKIRDASLTYDVFPWPLEQVNGTLDIHLVPGPDATGNRFTFRDFRARRGDGRVTINGSAQPLTHGTRIDLAIRGEQTPLDEALAGAFGRMKLRPVWDMLSPSGRMDFDAQLSHIENPGAPPEFSLQVHPRGAAVKPTFFSYALTDLDGVFRISRTRVGLENITARHGPAQLRIGSGAIDLNNGGYFADLRSIVAEPLPLDADLLHACPRALQSIFRTLDLQGALAVRVDRLMIDEPSRLPGPASPPLIYWKGQASFTDAALRTGIDWQNVTGAVACTGRYRGHALEGFAGHIALDRATVFRQPMTNLHVRMNVDPSAPHEMRLSQIQGQMYGGQLGGEAYIAFGAGVQYRVDLKALGIQLDEFARQNNLGSAQLSGLARAELYLTGNGTGADELEGAAAIHVPNGKLYNLPVLLDLMKVIGLHSPDGTAFEEAHVEVGIHGKKVAINRLDLLGHAVSLGGRGDMDLDGNNLKLDFYAVWGHIVQILPARLRDVPPWLSKNLFQITARGQLGGTIQYALAPIPGIVDPVRQLVETMQRRRKDQSANGPGIYIPRLKGN
jgi:hypothetical protein